jgi:glycosyltransferase involved in cell wall biosynthesis
MSFEVSHKPSRDRMRSIPENPTVSVVIPAMNEARNLRHVFVDLSPDLHQVILVDGRSTDDTVSTAQGLRPGIDVVYQTRKGKGNALACGFAAATGDIIVALDADGSTDPGEMHRFVDALCQGADFAKGSRFLIGGGSADLTRIRRAGNFLLRRLFNFLYGTHYSDLNYGYNAFWRDCLKVFEFPPLELGGSDDSTMQWGDGFEVEALITVRTVKAGLKVQEVPCFERDRLYGTSNLNVVSDGLRVLRVIRIERQRWRSRLALPAPKMSDTLSMTTSEERPIS